MSNNSNNIDNLLSNITGQFANIEEIKSRVIQAKKIQLHPNIDGFNSPKSYGIYRHTGGEPLGVVGEVFEPMNLGLFVDAIADSVLSCGQNVDLSKLKYVEHKGGAKVCFELPIGEKKLKSGAKVGDIIEQKLQFKTGFDGLTKISLSVFTLRLWCSNGAVSTKSDIALNFKNTVNNQAKALLFCDEIGKAISYSNDYVDQLNVLATRKITQAEIDAFMVKLTGFDVKTNKELSTKARNILNEINACIHTEVENTGMTAFSWLQGITRYTTHNLAKGNEEVLMYDHAAKLNKIAHELVMA